MNLFQDCVKALDKNWHSHHFVCGGCGLNFSAKDVGFHEHNNQAYCEHCYTNIVLPKCRACEKPITDRTMKAMGNQWSRAVLFLKVSLMFFTFNVRIWGPFHEKSYD